MDELKEIVNKLIADLKETNSNIANLIINNRNQKKEISNLRKYNKSYKNSLHLLELDFLNHSQYSRRENIEISNVPETILQRDLENHIIIVLRSIGIEVYSYDIVGVHRLGRYNEGTNRNVIIKFINRKNAYKALELNWKLDKSKFNYYFNENMCPRNRSIFNKCYRLKKDGEINDVWFEGGVVKINISELHDDPIGLFHSSDINYFLNENSFIIPSSVSSNDDY